MWIRFYDKGDLRGARRRVNYQYTSYHLSYFYVLLQAPLYNCSLSLYYVFVIKYNWTNARLAKIERYVHAFIITFAIGTSIAGLPLTMYNQIQTVCWVIGSPSECGNSSSKQSDVPCDRGDWAWLFGIILFYGPLWICVLLTIVAMTVIYLQVRRTFSRNKRYRFSQHFSANGRTRGVPSAPPRPTSVLSSIEPSLPENSKGNNDEEIDDVDDEPMKRASQVSHRMSRFSIFSSKNLKLETTEEVDEELRAAIHQAEKEDAGADVNEQDGINDHVTLAQESGHQPCDTLVSETTSNGIGIKQGWRRALGSGQPISTQELRRRKSANKLQRKQNMFAVQAILYSLSFFITWMPSTIWSLAHWFGASGIGFDLAAAACEPLQGFWNMLIFIQSRPSSKAKLRRVFGRFLCFCVAWCPNALDEEAESGQHSSEQDGPSRKSPTHSFHSNVAGRKRSNSASNDAVSQPPIPEADETT